MNSSAGSIRCFLAAFMVFVLVGHSPTASSQDEVDDLGVEVTLISAGNEPRRAVRFSPEVGQIQKSDLIVKMSQKILVGGMAMASQPIPPQKMTMETKVTDVSSDGDISFEFEYTNMKVIDDPNRPSPIAATLEKMLEPMIGSTGQGVVTNRGMTRSGKFNVPDDLSPQLKQLLAGMEDAMNRLSSPVPEEAIGEGAQWKITQRVVANGMKLTQTSIHTVTSMSKDGFEMSVKLEQEAESQVITNPMLPAGTKLKLDSLVSDGTAEITVEEAAVFPVSSKMKIDSNSNMSIDAAGQTQKMTTEITMEMSLQTVDE